MDRTEPGGPNPEQLAKEEREKHLRETTEILKEKDNRNHKLSIEGWRLLAEHEDYETYRNMGYNILYQLEVGLVSRLFGGPENLRGKTIILLGGAKNFRIKDKNSRAKNLSPAEILALHGAKVIVVDLYIDKKDFLPIPGITVLEGNLKDLSLEKKADLLVTQSVFTNRMAPDFFNETLEASKDLALLQAHICAQFESPYPKLKEEELPGKVLFCDTKKEGEGFNGRTHFLIIDNQE